MARRCLLILLFAMAGWSQPPVKLDLSWMSGTWEGEMWGGRDTEIWSVPGEDGEMFGSYLFVKEGKPVFYELFAIEKQEGKLVLVMRHFGPGLVAKEARDGAMRFSVEQTGEREAHFRQIYPQGKEAILRYWLESPDQLRMELIKVEAGKRTVERFEFRRAKR